MPWFEPGIAIAAAVLDPQYANATEYLTGYHHSDEKAKEVVDASWLRLEGDFGVFCNKYFEVSSMEMENYVDWGK